MNLLHRVFYGRVAKSRPASSKRNQGNTPKASFQSSAHFRQARSPTARTGSGITPPSFAEFQSPQHNQCPQGGAATILNIRIKTEDEEDAFTVPSTKVDDLPLVAVKGNPDGHMPIDDESNEDGDDAVGEELNAMGRLILDSDEPIPSIEEEHNVIEEEEHPGLHRENPPFLHGTTRKPDRVQDSVSGGGVGRGVEEEAFEEQLADEIEDNLLIDDKDLRYWLRHKSSTAGIENWPREACRLYKLLFLRGLYPMFNSQWTWNFLDHPMPGQLFTPLGNDDKCLLKAQMSDYHASKALIRLFNLHGYVSDYRQCSMQKKTAPLIEKEIKRYILWAETDSDFVKKHDYVSPVFVITYTDAQTANTGRPIVERCQTLVQEYRSQYGARGIKDYPRCIYIFVVVQHIVLVMVADTEHSDDEEPYPLAELDLSQRSHWLDYSLGIAITVMLARESLLACRWAFPRVELLEDDPDL